MNPDEDGLDDFLERIEPMTDAEQYEMLLRYASAGFEHLDKAGLLELRDHLLSTLPDNEHRATLVQVIEGKIALRDITGG